MKSYKKHPNVANIRKSGKAFLYNGMGLFNLFIGLLVIFPLVYCLFSSFKPPSEMNSYPPRLLPRNFLNIQNYVDVFTMTPIFRYMLNSSIMSLVGTLIRLCTASLAAFSFSFFNYKGKNLLFFFILGIMMIPGESVLVANYINVSRAGLIDSYIGLLSVYGLSAANVFIMRQYMNTLPKALHDSALIDGCSSLRFLAQVVLPCCAPVLYTVSISSIVNLWNAYLWPLMITNRLYMRTVQVGITMLSDTDNPAYHTEMAGVCFILIPSLLIYLLFQRRIVAGITTGSEKS